MSGSRATAIFWIFAVTLSVLAAFLFLRSNETKVRDTSSSPSAQSLGRAEVDALARTITVAGPKGRLRLHLHIPPGLHTTHTSKDGREAVYKWEETSVKLWAEEEGGLGKVRVRVEGASGGRVDASVDLGHFHWFGGAEIYAQRWPIEGTNMSLHPYSTDNLFAVSPQGAWGSVMERYWVSSGGVALTASEDCPLSVALNGSLHLSAFLTHTPYANTLEPGTPPWLDLTFWLPSSPDTASLRDLQLAMVANHLGKPSETPDPRMMLQPVWSTWVRYGQVITAGLVLDFAREIVSHGFVGSQVEVDDRWATREGDLTMSPFKFPDPRNFTKQLRALGFRSTLWIHPLANLDSRAAAETGNAGYWVKNKEGVPGKVKWWDGQGYSLDTTNPSATTWFVGRLKQFLTDTGFDSYKFDAGEANWLPEDFRLANASYPNQFSRAYVEEVVWKLGRVAETRIGTRTQASPLFLRFLDRDSTWSRDNGLASLIPATLTLGILGYPFVLPDMLGGNGRAGRELYIRWLQVNTFLPCIQFSITPWDFDANVTDHAKTLLAAREGKADLFTSLAAEAVSSGSPMVRPTWWTGDESEGALTADDQFLLGDDFLVAPVLAQGATSRSVYLPERGAQWKSGLDGRVYDGAQTLTVSALLYQLPTFTRVQ